MINMGGWYWYLSGEEEKLDRHKCGKWMYRNYAPGHAKRHYADKR